MADEENAKRKRKENEEKKEAEREAKRRDKEDREKKREEVRYILIILLFKLKKQTNKQNKSKNKDLYILYILFIYFLQKQKSMLIKRKKESVQIYECLLCKAQCREEDGNDWFCCDFCDTWSCGDEDCRNVLSIHESKKCSGKK